MSRDENKVKNLIKSDEKDKAKENNIFSTIKIETVSIKPHLNISKFNFMNNKKYNEFLKELQDKIKNKK